MFNINFKENLKETISDEISDLISNEVDKVLDNEPATITEIPSVYQPISGPLHTDKYEELVELIKQESKKQVVINKQKGENLFSAKSVITTLAFLVTSVLIQVDVALADNIISSREGIQIAITLIGAFSTVAARGAEGDQGVYTPHGLPGLDKEFYDLNQNGIDDRLE